MLRPLFAAAALGSLAFAAIAQESNAPRTSAADFLARHPGAWRVVNEPVSGNPAFVYGDRFSIGGRQGNAAGWEAAARAVVDDHRELFGLASAQLNLREVKPLMLSRIGSSDKVAVTFDQTVDGIPVYNGSVSILFDADLTPRITASQAIAYAEVAYLAHFGGALTEVTNIEPVIVGASAFFGRKTPLTDKGTVLAWKIDGKTPGLRTDLNVPMQGRVFVAADDGAVIKVIETAHAIDGKVSGNVNVSHEPNTTTNQENVGLSNVRIRQNNATGAILATTDANGNFTIGQAGPLTLFVELRGPYCRVVNEAATSTTFTQAGVVSGTPWNPTFNTSFLELPTAEVAGWHHVAKFRDWIKSVDPTDAAMDFEVRTEVNKNDLLCNAYYDGTAINMERAGNGCTNTAYQDVIQHEEGHWANEVYNGGVTGAFHEGNADNFAYYINDDPCLTTFTGGTGCLRTALQTSIKKCTVDGDESCNGGQVHTEGQALASAAWAVRTRLQNSLGDAQSDLIADSLFLAWMQTYNDNAILNVIMDHWLALDDDNGNMGDLTPHFAHINGGFKDYGWPGVPDPQLSITAGPADNAEIGDQQAVTVKATALSTISSVNLVRAFYSTNGTTFTQVTMAPTGQPNEYSATIPGMASPNTVFWYVNASNLLGDTANAPNGAPTNRRVYHVGDMVILQQYTFEAGTDEGWTHVNLSGSNGDQWQRNNPANSESSNDPAAAFSGTRVWGTDLSATGTDGKYEPSSSGELRSPTFNLATSPKVRLQYRRMLAVEQGQFDQASIRVNGAVVFQNPTAPDLIDPDWTLHDLDITAQAANNAAVQITYRIAADGGVEFGGWNLDDFTLYRVDANPAGFFQTYGAGCPGTGGLVPTLAGTGTPTPGQNVTISVGNGKANGAGVLLIGTAQVSLPAAGSCVLLAGGALLPLSFSLNGAGQLAIPGTIPPGTPANDTYWQWFGGDSGAPNFSYSASNGLRMRIQ
jgi:hypothetical protein